MTEGLLHHHPGMLGETSRGETLDNHAEQRGWDLQVEHRQGRDSKSFRDGSIGGRVRKVTADVAHPLPQTLKGSLIDLSVAERSRHRLGGASPEILIGPV